MLCTSTDSLKTESCSENKVLHPQAVTAHANKSVSAHVRESDPRFKLVIECSLPQQAAAEAEIVRLLAASGACHQSQLRRPVNETVPAKWGARLSFLLCSIHTEMTSLKGDCEFTFGKRTGTLMLGSTRNNGFSRHNHFLQSVGLSSSDWFGVHQLVSPRVWSSYLAPLAFRVWQLANVSNFRVEMSRG